MPYFIISFFSKIISYYFQNHILLFFIYNLCFFLHSYQKNTKYLLFVENSFYICITQSKKIF